MARLVVVYLVACSLLGVFSFPINHVIFLETRRQFAQTPSQISNLLLNLFRHSISTLLLM